MKFKKLLLIPIIIFFYATLLFGNINIISFPNPSDNSCTVTYKSITNNTLYMYDIKGRLVLQSDNRVYYNHNTYTVFYISTSNLASGKYIIKINKSTKVITILK